MTSGEYWEKRAIERALRLERGTLPYIRKLASLYARAYRSLREDLDRLFERYVETGDFSPEEAAAYLREPVTPKERKILEDALKGITDEDERRKAVARINSASYRARMDRLHAMQERIRIECAKTAPDVIDTIRQAMERSGREAYYRTIFDNSKAAGVQLPFTDLSLERLEGVINQKIEGKSVSSRVWGNTNAVAQLLTDTLKENVATGRSWRRSVSDMRELLGVDYPGGATYAATRILRTETARVNNELSAEANVENGFDRYRYIAMLDSKTTEACRDHDGGIDPDTKKPYTYKNRKLGVNFPPLHPNCRSTTCAWVNEELLATITRSAKDENGNVYQIPGNMTYREWEADRQKRGEEQDLIYLQKLLGAAAPNTIETYRRLKEAQSDEWKLLQKRKAFTEKLKAGKIPIQVSPQKQAKHILGSKRWKEETAKAFKAGHLLPGAFYKTVDVSVLVARYSGRGTLLFQASDAYPREQITTDAICGVAYSRVKGKYVLTRRIRIHYASNNLHAFPILEEDDGDE